MFGRGEPYSYGLRSGTDVLINAEEVAGIVLGFDGCQTSVVIAVCCANPLLSFFHHEVHISTAGAEGMQSVVISSSPIRDLGAIRWIGIYSDDDLAPDDIAIIEG